MSTRMHSSYYRRPKKVSSSLDGEYLPHPVSQVYPTVAPPSSSPCPPGSSIQIDCRLEGSSTKTCVRHETGKGSSDGGRCTYVFLCDTATVADGCGVGRVTVDMLPDVALLEIFDCYVNQAREEVQYLPPAKIEAWHTLVHVCRTWRTIVLGSPSRLDLQLFCTNKTPAKERLTIWPLLPIVIVQNGRPIQMDNIIAALEHTDRVRQIHLLDIIIPELEVFLAATHQPFPALTDLALWHPGQWVEDEMIEMPVIPELFLGGFAPRLQYLSLSRIPFSGLPKLLLSTTVLVELSILEIPHSGYISPEAMVRCLSTLTRLEYLSLGFQSPLSRPVQESRRPHPSTRLALPTLTDFQFEGVSEYLEDFVARIDAPLLEDLQIAFFHQLIFDTPQLVQFFARTPNIQPRVNAHIVFFNRYVEISSSSSSSFTPKIMLRIGCSQSDWQLSSLAQLNSSSLPEAFIPTVERLYIYQYKYDEPRWQDDIEDSQWLEVLQPFTALKVLHVSQEFLPRLGPAFQELAGERVTEILPALQSLCLEELHPSGPVREAFEKFVAARQLAGHPIALSDWSGPADSDEEQDEWSEGDESDD